MSDSSSSLPARPSLEQLQKQAKDLLRQYRGGESVARQRFHAAIPRLADAQFVIAREYGFETWAKLKQHIEALRPSGMQQYERLAKDVAAAYMLGDSKAIRELNWSYGTAFAWDRKPVDMQRRPTAWFRSEARTLALAIADARQIVAHSYGFEN
ncbi:MAG TPA: hypothetical protein VK493_01990 [Bryobacteraceae bacterium]|nr:hypothetical protein [Bryobacteraceae bacterium]